MTVLLEESCNRGVVGNAVGKQKAQPYVDPNLDPILLVPDIVGLIVKAVDNNNAKEERGLDLDSRSGLQTPY
jgi:hypothetical protein